MLQHIENEYTKKCYRCEKLLEKDMFYRDKSRKDGLEHQCKNCRLLQSKDYYAVNAQAVVARTVLYAQNHREATNARTRKWRQNNLESARESVRRSYRKYRKKIAQQKKIWLKNNPEKVKHYAAKSLAMRRGASGAGLTKEQWEFILEKSGSRCTYCQKKMGEPTRDHVIAVSKGGEHTMENIVPACRSCNSRKNNKKAPIPVQTCLPLAFASSDGRKIMVRR